MKPPTDPPPGLIAVPMPKVVLPLTEAEYVRGAKRGRRGRIGQRGLDHAALGRELLEPFQDPLGRRLAHEHEESGTAGLERSGQVFHEPVVDADVREFPESAPAPAPTAAPINGFRKSSPMSDPQNAPLTRTACCEVDRLVELHCALLVAGHHDRVFHLNQVLFLQVDEGRAHRERIGDIVKPTTTW